jgi:hypothetical protein
MKKFSEFGIEPPVAGFSGDKIKISKILNRKIAVHDFKVEDSKFNGERLTLSIEVDDERRVVFTGSRALLDNAKKINRDNLPFETTIVENNDRYLFS